MAIKSQLHLLAPVTLCFLLAVAAQGRELNVTVVVQGQAKCKNNPSAVMSHATLHLMINGTTVPGAAGTTTSTGEVVMAVNLTTTSTQQLLSIISGSSRMLVTAPPNACGAPTGTVLGAQLNATALLMEGAAGGVETSIPIFQDELDAAIEAEVARLEAEGDDDGLDQLRIAATGSSHRFFRVG